MQASVSGKHLDVGDALRGRVVSELSAIVEEYFGTGIDATVGFERVRHLYRCQISVHFGRDMPAVIAEMESEIPRLTVAAAVMRLDLADLAALLFRNDAMAG